MIGKYLRGAGIRAARGVQGQLMGRKQQPEIQGRQVTAQRRIQRQQLGVRQLLCHSRIGLYRLRLLLAAAGAGPLLLRTLAGCCAAGPNWQGLAMQVNTRIEQQQQMGQ